MNRLLEYHINNGNNNEDYVFYNSKLFTKSKLKKKTVVSIYYKEKNRKLLVTSLNTNIMYIEENTWYIFF